MVVKKNFDWVVYATRKAEKSLAKMPVAEQKHYPALADDLRLTGPVQAAWPNYSKLHGNVHHCHLSHQWVACWEVKEKKFELSKCST